MEFSLIIHQAFEWLLYAFAFFIPYSITKFVLVKEGKEAPKGLWNNVKYYLTAIIFSLILAAIVISMGHRGEYNDQSLSKIISGLIVFSLAVCVGVYQAHKTIRKQSYQNNSN